LGLILTFFSFFFADFLATNLFSRPAIAPLIQIVSFAVLANSIVVTATATFTGYEKMELNSIMLIVQSVFKTALIIGLVALGFGAAGATIGFTSGVIFASIVGMILIWTIYRRLPKPYSHKLEIKAYLTAMLTYCLPLSVVTVISGLLPQFYAFLLPIHYATDNTMIGNYGVAMNFVVLITFFSIPITSMLFPAFSKLDPEKDIDALKSAFQFSVKYASLLVVPVTAIVICLSQPAVETLFGTVYNTAPLFLALLAIQYLYTALGNLSLSGFLNGQGKTKYVLKLALLNGSIGFPMGYLLIMAYGVIGLIVTTLVSALPGIFLGLRFIQKNYGITVDWLSSAKILFSSAIAASVTYAAISLMHFSSWITLILGVLLFIVVFIPSALLTRSINQFDIVNLCDMTSSLGTVGKILKTILGIFGKLMTYFKL
jgi:O-antigen/teichoic acid export membrane protein